MNLWRRIACTALLAALAGPAAAQDIWIQIAARQSRAEAIALAEEYAARLDTVQSFAIERSRWNAIVLGPFDEDMIETRRRDLRFRGAIPADSFLTDGRRFAERLYPDADAAPSTAPAAAPPGTAGGQSLIEARNAERRLDAAERRRVQMALRSAGVYDAAIDGAFGRGTRTAMADWQRAQGFEPTGVLTSRQRADLLAAYDALLDGLDVQRVSDTKAGIAIDMPTARVSFDRYDPPFAHYTAADGDLPRVLLISQKGGRAELRGLYEVLQTLEIVPPQGERSRNATSFSLTGRNGTLVSQTEARLVNGTIRGFMLVWPADDDPSRQRLMSEMLESFEVDPAHVLDQAINPPVEDQSVDLLAGLSVRTPTVIRSGFFVSRRGDVLTTADVATDCSRITLDDDIEATVAALDPASGLALLKPAVVLAPRQHAVFREGVPRLGSEAILSGYPFDGQLGAPSLTHGRLAAMQGLGGRENVRRYELAARSGDAGGPVFDRAGTVLGALTPTASGPRTLPEDVAFAIDVETITSFLAEAGISADRAPAEAPLHRSHLEQRAADMTVLVGCWRPTG